MSPVEIVLAKLPGAKKAGKGWSARCPAHEDRKASLSVSAGDDGRALVNCHKGCSVEAVVSAIGLTVRDLMPPDPSAAPNRHGKPKPDGKAFPTAKEAVAELERRHGKRSALWTYHNSHGDPVGLVVRWDRPEGKDIRPVARHGDGWRIGAMPDPRPLYCLPELTSAKLVIVTEGEKAADAARSIGFVATTSAGGSQVAVKTDWSPLSGKEVWILPDNDPPGQKFANTVAAILAKLTPACVVRIVALPGLPEKGDIVDWLNDQGDAAEPEVLRQHLETLSRAVEPESVVPKTDDLERFRPFPVEALPVPIRGFVVAGAKAIGCDPSYLALPLLTSMAAAIGNTRRLELKRGWSAPAIIWSAIVGESGTMKTPAYKLVMRPILERQRKAMAQHAEAMKQYDAELARWEKDFAAWKRDKKTADEPPVKPNEPACERFVVTDTTVEALAPILLANPRGLLLARDELSGWIGSFDRYAGKKTTGADSANWLSMFNAESMIVDRKTGIPRTIHVPQAAVCVTGGIQPGILQRALGAEHRESGLAARLLLTIPPRKEKEWTEADIDPAAEAELARLFDRLLDLQPIEGDDGEPRAVLVRMDASAKSAWIAYYNSHATEQVDLTGDLSAAWSKLEEYAARLALVVHFARWAAGDPDLTNANILDGTSMSAGIVLTNWFKIEARRIYALLDETETERNQRRTIEWIVRKGGTVSAREAQQGCRWLKESGVAEAALEDLVNAGCGKWQPIETTPKGGQPSRVFVMNAPTVVYGTPETPRENRGSVDVDTVDGPSEAPDARKPSEGRLFPDGRGLPD